MGAGMMPPQSLSDCETTYNDFVLPMLSKTQVVSILKLYFTIILTDFDKLILCADVLTIDQVQALET